jgi:hypothetical protein
MRIRWPEDQPRRGYAVALVALAAVLLWGVLLALGGLLD